MALAIGKTIVGNDGKKGIDYSAWGTQATRAAEQNWYPETSYNGETVWRTGYNAPFNDVYDPKAPTTRGHIAIVSKPNKKFDIVIRDKDYKVLNKPATDVTPDFVQDYLTNYNSTVAQRNRRSILNTSPTALQIVSR